MRRAELEEVILAALQERLLTPERTKLFSEAYAREMNRLLSERNAGRAADEAALAKTDRELDRLVQALLDGVSATRVKDKMAELEARKEELEARLAAGRDEKVALHPNISEHYRRQVADLREALTGDDKSLEAAEIVRSLIETVRLTPVVQDGEQSLAVDLEGHIATIMALAHKEKAPLDESDARVRVTKMVAGVGFEPTTFRL